MQIAMPGSERVHLHSWTFAAVWIPVFLASWGTARALVTLASENDAYTHLLVIAPISLFLIWLDRRHIFAAARSAGRFEIAAAVAAAILYAFAAPWARRNPLDERLWLPALAIIVTWIAVFLLLYGSRSATAAVFPLCFLLLMVPIPGHILDRIVWALQAGSAQLTFVLFKLLRVPVLQNGFRFSLPGIDIEIAKECSGIRSSWALLITGSLAAHLFLRSAWNKLWFILLIVPVAVFKNAVRIVTLSYLAVYVNREFLLGSLHHRGGPLFALVGFAILGPALFLFRRLENRRSGDQRLAPAPVA
jgi:exosortase